LRGSSQLNAAAEAVLEVERLSVRIRSPQGDLPAVEDMSFAVGPGRTLCLVGESGCGKTMTALSLLRLQPEAAEIVDGVVRLDGLDLLRLPRRQLEDIRGDRVSMIFQEPMTALNPVTTIGHQIAEALRRHRKLSAAAAHERAVEMLGLVRLPDPERRAGEYPHRLSGGMRQRAMIAMALACEPRVVIADEPTTALDVTIQAQILGLMCDLQGRMGTALVLITHDLGVVAEMADDVVVMYAGRGVEIAPVEELFDHPLHPYTRRLMRAAPRLKAGGEGDLPEIAGTVPPLWDLPPGCAFAPRCAHATGRCRAERPILEEVRPGHLVACFEWERLAAELVHAGS
jgi:peptide/nickel transport system ATP-binding protein